MIRGMIRGYDSHKSNFLPLLKTAPVKKDTAIYIYANIYIFNVKSSGWKYPPVPAGGPRFLFLDLWYEPVIHGHIVCII